MFAQLDSGQSSADRKILASSLVLHGLLFAWLLRAPEPQLLNPTSVALGHEGQLVTRVYFPTPTPDDSTTSSPAHATEVYRHQRLGHEKLILKQNTALAKLPLPQAPLNPSSAEDRSKTPTLSNLGHGAPAGLPYGSLPGGPVYGDEIRPALPVATADPAIYPWQRPDSEGKVVIEITIDERGEIVRKTVLQSLGSAIDQKCLAALESWHFRPATRNGVPIPSKQDAIFPFKARG
ncbi:MAG: TonB family protein [Candidatus Sulfotelmatobacter sp.]